MSSALPVDPYSNSAAVYAAGGQAGLASDESGALHYRMDARQQLLTWLWGFYKTTNYDGRKVNYDGSPAQGALEHDAIATEGYIPPGFVDTSGASLPVQFRKPYAPYFLIREIVDRFSNLLFAEGRVPSIQVDGDDDTADYYSALAEEGDLWGAMSRARTFGGAMTAAAVSFALVEGRPVFQVHDPRWCWPSFEDAAQTRLSRFEKKYVFQDYMRDADGEIFKDADGLPIVGWFWYRRVIDKQTDRVWERVPARDPEEPDWERYESQDAEHGLGVVPVRWVRNLPVEEGVDGEPDAAGVYVLIMAFDMLMSAAQQATLANCNPDMLLITNDDIEEIVRKVGSAIKLPAGSEGKLLEMAGSGPKTAMELADKIREIAFEIAACVPDVQGTAEKQAKKTATEVIALRSRMIDKAGNMRREYGAAIVDLLQIADAAVRGAAKPRPGKLRSTDGTERSVMVQGVVKLPPRVVKQQNGGTARVERKLGPGGKIRLVWPRFLEPTLDDTLKAVQSVVAAVTAKLIDRKTAAMFLKDYLPIDDIDEMLKRADDDSSAQSAALAQHMMQGIQRKPGVGTPKPPGGG